MNITFQLIGLKDGAILKKEGCGKDRNGKSKIAVVQSANKKFRC